MRPRALAVLRFMASSNFTGCCQSHRLNRRSWLLIVVEMGIVRANSETAQLRIARRYEISLIQLRHAFLTALSCRIVLAEKGPFEWHYPIKTPQQKIRKIHPRATPNISNAAEGWCTFRDELIQSQTIPIPLAALVPAASARI